MSEERRYRHRPGVPWFSRMLRRTEIASARQLKTTEVLKNLAQAAAVIGGTIWAIYTFSIKETPAREAFLDGSNQLAWAPGPTPETCVAEWTLTVKNVSTRTLNVERVDLVVWPFNYPTQASVEPAYVDIAGARKAGTAKALFVKRYVQIDDPLTGRYAPPEVAQRTFEWVFDRAKSPRWVVFDIYLYADRGGKTLMWRASDSDEVCGQESVAASSSTTGHVPAAQESLMSTPAAAR